MPDQNIWNQLGQQLNGIQAPAPVSYGSNFTPGQMAQGVQVPTYTDPYAGLLTQGQNMVGNAQSFATAQVPQLQQQMMGMQQQGNNYPSYPNGAGAGSQTAMQMPQMSLAQPSSSSQPPSNPYSFSQGANPWSLSGEALSRGK